jgi:hypothetical protein
LRKREGWAQCRRKLWGGGVQVKRRRPSQRAAIIARDAAVPWRGSMAQAGGGEEEGICAIRIILKRTG